MSRTAQSKIPINFMLVLGIGVVAGLVYVAYRAVFPESYWRSRELEQNRAKWESQHVSHYRMSLYISGYAHGSDYDRLPLTVEVKDDAIVSVLDAHGQRIVPGKENPYYTDYPQAFTIPGLFAIAYDWIEQKTAAMDISYDSARGYPTEIYIDPYWEPCCQDLTYSLRSVQVLPP